ncbi:hypothetical protein M3J09_003126 [Ascochyta lentis]
MRLPSSWVSPCTYLSTFYNFIQPTLLPLLWPTTASTLSNVTYTPTATRQLSISKVPWCCFAHLSRRHDFSAVQMVRKLLLRFHQTGKSRDF